MKTFEACLKQRRFHGTPEDRFWRSIQKTDGCWLWTAAKNRGGYGVMSVGEGRLEIVSRFSWQLHFGPIPPRLFVCHKCDVRSCASPEHLFLGTAADNSRDMRSKGRGPKPDQQGSPGSAHPMAKLTEADVLEIRSLYGSSGVTLKSLASTYGVTLQMIHCVVKRKSWVHI